MRTFANILLITCLVVAVTGCESRTDRTDGGGVLLSITDFDGLPIAVSVNATLSAGGFVQVEEIVISNVPKNPTGTTSELMNVEIQSYEVIYSRADSGTRVPKPFTRGLFGVVPVGGTFTAENLPVMSSDQLTSVPLSDLRFSDGAFDKETGLRKIVMNLSISFFGRTLSGNAVATEPARFTIEFTP
jgi:hypothetical protein